MFGCYGYCVLWMAVCYWKTDLGSRRAKSMWSGCNTATLAASQGINRLATKAPGKVRSSWVFMTVAERLNSMRDLDCNKASNSGGQCRVSSHCCQPWQYLAQSVSKPVDSDCSANVAAASRLLKAPGPTCRRRTIAQ